MKKSEEVSEETVGGSVFEPERHEAGIASLVPF
jgi:hypothetical protein